MSSQEKGTETLRDIEGSGPCDDKGRDGVMQPHVEECQGLSEEPERLEPSERARPCRHPGSGLLASGTMKECISLF